MVCRGRRFFSGRRPKPDSDTFHVVANGSTGQRRQRSKSACCTVCAGFRCVSRSPGSNRCHHAETSPGSKSEALKLKRQSCKHANISCPNHQGACLENHEGPESKILLGSVPLFRHHGRDRAWAEAQNNSQNREPQISAG